MRGSSVRKRTDHRRRRSSSTLEALECRCLLSAPNGPYGLVAAATGPAAVSLRFSDNATDEPAFVIERSVNGGAFAPLSTLPAHDGTGYVLYADNAVVAGSSYSYRVYAKTSDTPSSIAGPA